MNTQKTIVRFLVGSLAVMLVGAVPMAFADTTTTTVSSSVQAQLSLIQSLTAQLQALEQQMQNLQQQRQTAVGQLLSTLQIGSQGSQVSVLQALLATDANIYPEGLVTGYFGPATQRAVKRFQAANGLEQVGFVGPMTRGKLNGLLKDNPIVVQSTSTQPDANDDHEGVGIGRICAMVPPGHLIAPGWLKHHGGEVPVVPPCQTLPPGIINQLPSSTPNPTSTPALTLSNLNASVTTSTAGISWNTSNAANSQVFFGLTSSYGMSTSLDAAMVTSHLETISGLAPSTTYHYQVRSVDGYEQTVTSSDQTFTTGAISTPTPLTISNVSFSASTSSAIITWTTNNPANSQVAFGLTSSYGTNTNLDPTLVTSHSVTLSGLAASTTYHFQVKSIDGNNSTATSSDMTFTTTALPTAPVISAITATPSSSTAVVSWTTDQQANGMVFWSTVSPVNVSATSTFSTGTSSLSTSHSFTLTGLATSTTYFFLVQSTNAANLTSTSSQQSFVTAAQ